MVMATNIDLISHFMFGSLSCTPKSLSKCESGPLERNSQRSQLRDYVLAGAPNKKVSCQLDPCHLTKLKNEVL